jgi:zinc D-Ala-D-Ala dipeptidase
MGSAIFMHIRRGEGIPTEGCVAMSEEAMLRLLQWLDPSRKPVIIMGSSAGLAMMREGKAYCHDLVDIEGINRNIAVDIRYATENNFTGEKVYPAAKCFLKRAAASKLDTVQRQLEKKGLGLKVWDCYRPLSVQRAFWALVPDERYVADPAKGSRHNRGYAVDITLVDSSGAEVMMPTGFDDFSEKAHRSFTALPEKALKNSRLLEGLMKKAGFIPFPSEWWHFDDAEWEQGGIMDVSFDELREAGCWVGREAGR